MARSSDRVALITGANRGIGYALARVLAKLGLQVVLGARSEEAAMTAAASLASEGHTVTGHQLDVANIASISRAVADTAHAFGRLDVLVNNAGVAIDRGLDASSLDMERIKATFETNLFGAWRCTNTAALHMKKQRYGRILNLSTHMASLATMAATSPAYRVSKAALNALTRVHADELRDYNILVNAASPGKVDTRMSYGGAEQSPDQAAAAMAWLTTLPDDGPTGRLYHGHEPMDW